MGWRFSFVPIPDEPLVPARGSIGGIYKIILFRASWRAFSFV
jgi:hypothetical protein